MFIRLTAIALSMTAASAASASTVLDTHEIMWMPSGKTPAMLFRPVAGKKACANAARPANGRLETSRSACEPRSDRRRSR